MPHTTSHAALVVLAAVLAAPHAPAQGSRNVTLLAKFKPEQRFNDVWGYRSPAGKEYALLGSVTGTYVVDCTDPTKPVQRGFFPASASNWRNSTWRDIKTYRQYAYVVTEGGGGMQILDLRDPDRPKLLKTWGQNLWRNAHNLAIDVTAGIAYVCGASFGTPILDLKDPENPKQIGNYIFPYVHDMQAQNGYAHVADIYGNNYIVLDVSKLPATPELGRARAPGLIFCHNTWATRDDAYCVTSNEIVGGPLGVFDIRDKRQPKLIASWTPNFLSSIHNVTAHDRLAHAAWYTEGYQVVDLSNPARPVPVGHYDTYAGPSLGFNGAWGVYPFQPSGVIYLSDIQGGLYLLRPKAAAARYGKATPPAGKPAPALHAFGAAYLGNANFALEVESALPSRPGVLVLGTRKKTSVFAGLWLNVDLADPGLVLADVRTDARGKARLSLPVPTDPRLAGQRVHAQVVLTGGPAPLGLASSRGLEFELFTR